MMYSKNHWRDECKHADEDYRMNIISETEYNVLKAIASSDSFVDLMLAMKTKDEALKLANFLRMFIEDIETQ